MLKKIQFNLGQYISKSLPLKSAFTSLIVASSMALTGCGEGTSSSQGEDFNNSGKDTTTNFNQAQLITNLVDNVVTPTFQEFHTLVESQQLAFNNYCQQEQLVEQGTGSESETAAQKNNAKQAWRNTMVIWQQIEMMQIGPLLENDGMIKNNIYSWPVTNTCGVDLDVTYFKNNSVSGKPYDITKRTASRKSMLALEYLLFNDNLAHSCTSTTTPESWNNQTEQYRKVARCEFAQEVANDVTYNSQLLINAWLGSNGETGYADKLKAAGTQNSDFATEHEAINRISDAIFYLDKFTKDSKLAKPIGLIDNECGNQACPTAVESKYSQHSIENIISNLRALDKFMSGESGLGFRDYLIDVGDQTTADAIAADVLQALTTTQAYQESLANTLTTNSEQVVDTHSEIKNITDKLKSDFINSLALELPQTAAGDND